MEYLIIEYLWFFIIYAFLGWCVEVAYHVVTRAKFVNRGFLNGPICPIYGFGMDILIFCLHSLIENPFLLFLGSFFLTSILEYITGFVLEKVFNDKWWDYSNLPFNVNGYISLSFSIIWGLGGVFMLKIVHQPIYKLVTILYNNIGNIIVFILFIILIIDFIATILGIMNIKKRLILIHEIEEELNLLSEHLGNRIYRGMTEANSAKEVIENKFEELGNLKPELRSEIDKINQHFMDLNTKYKKLLERKGFIHRRLEKTFPKLKKRLSDLGFKDK